MRLLTRLWCWFVGNKHYDLPGMTRYKGYLIQRNPYHWMEHPWIFAHEDYRGPTDNRFGTAATVEDCKREIDRQVG